MTKEAVVSTQEIAQDVKRFKAAQKMGKIANKLEADVAELRRAVGELSLGPLEAPEGLVFKIKALGREGALVIEPFNHGRFEWGDAYRTSDPEYNAMVHRSPYGDDVSMVVNSLEYDPGEAQIWGYNSLRRVRVLVDGRVGIDLVATQDADRT